MQNVVMITGQYPPMRCATGTLESANACAEHLRAMFPHLRNDDYVKVVPHDDWQVVDSTPVTGFPRDCVQAFITTGNGHARPTVGTLTLAQKES